MPDHSYTLFMMVNPKYGPTSCTSNCPFDKKSAICQPKEEKKKKNTTAPPPAHIRRGERKPENMLFFVCPWYLKQLLK
jgi:hypothetical protein